MSLRYYYDSQRHLVCWPYTRANLHRMATDLGIDRCWFHARPYPHYDIPQRRSAEITTRCTLVRPRVILGLCKGHYPDAAPATL